MEVKRVDGHLDRKKKNEKLTPLKEINVIMDEMAGGMLRE